MRKIALAGAFSLLAVAAVTAAQADVAQTQGTWQLRSTTSSSARALHRVRAGVAPSIFRKRATTYAATGAARVAILSAYETDIVRRVNVIRVARGLRPFRVSRGLSAAAAYHSNQMGLRGFFEHESANGAAFWKRIERFYPVLRGRSWSVGENILWGSPDISPASAVREWMASPPHRANLLSPGWREIGLGAVHFPAAPGQYEGDPVTIVTADFGTRA